MARILIAEDSPTQAERLAAALEERGFEVTRAEDGKRALLRFAAEPYDVVISDVVMPGMSGYEFCRAIKADKTKGHVPVILLTSLHEPMDIIRGLEAGADNFLTKPYQTDDLIRRIDRILDNKRVRGRSRVAVGVDIVFLGKTFTITSDKEQILDLLISIFEDTIRANQELHRSKTELAAAKAKIQTYAGELEDRVRERTAALSESEARLDRAQEIAGIGSWEVEFSTGRVFWSKEMYRIRGVEGASSPFTLQSGARDIDPEDWPRVREWFEQLRAGRELQAIECRIHRPDGETRVVSFEGKPIVEEAGKVTKIAGTLRDVTERRLTQQQLVQAQKMEAIGNLTGGIAHDFNNLLGIVIGNLDLLCDTKAGDAEVAELAGEARDAALRGAELTKRLLAFARRQPLRAVRVDINETVAGITKLLDRTIGEHIEVKLSLDPTVWPVVADPAQLEASLTNLATNARDAMPKGGRLTISTQNSQLDAEYAERNDEVTPGDYALIEVSDTGTGIAPEVIEHIFEPFYTTKEHGKGTGLGLSMVFGYVKQSGGHISVYSEKSVGTTFRLYLPRANEGAKASARSKATPAASGNGETILAVEDNPALRRIVVKQLHELNYKVLEAEDAAAALSALEHEPIDLLFTDIIMPGATTGFDIARIAHARWPKVRVVLTSGFSQTNLFDDMQSSGSVHLLSKPYRKEDWRGSWRLP